jgi:hypothetical protein
VSQWGSFSYAYGPLVAVSAVLVLVAVLRWSHRSGGSLVSRRVQPSTPDDYGMLTAVAAPATFAQGEFDRQRLEGSGIRATLAMTNDGPRLMVFPEDRDRATRILSG